MVVVDIQAVPPKLPSSGSGRDRSLSRAVQNRIDLVAICCTVVEALVEDRRAAAEDMADGRDVAVAEDIAVEFAMNDTGDVVRAVQADVDLDLDGSHSKLVDTAVHKLEVEDLVEALSLAGQDLPWSVSVREAGDGGALVVAQVLEPG